MIHNKFILFVVIFLLSLNSMAATFRVSDLPNEASVNAKSSPEANTGGNFASSNNYLAIKRDITPHYKDFNLIDEVCSINVTIQGCNRIIRDVIIKEKIDDKIKLNNDSDFHIYIEDPIYSSKREIRKFNTTSSEINRFTKISQIINNMIENYTIYNNSIFMTIPVLYPGENIVYNYKIKCEKSGIYEVATLLRLDNSNRMDLEQIAAIDIRPPEIEVTTQTDQSFVVADNLLNVTYNILHKSGWCNNEINLSISFDQSKEYTIYYDNGTITYDGENINISVAPLEIKKYNIKIKYNDAGKYNIPVLNIEGATVYQKTDTIDVISNSIIKKAQDNAALITAGGLIIAILALFAAIREIGSAQRQIDLLIELVEISPKYARGWCRKGWSLYSQGKYNEAIQAYNRAIEIDPWHVMSWNNKGLALNKQGKHDEAIQAYDKAIEINPQHATAWNNKGLALSKQGKYDDAIQAHDKAIDINLYFAAPWDNKGQILARLARHDEAIKCYDKAIDLDNVNPIIWYHKANSLIELGRTEEAESAFATAKKLEYTY